MNQWQSKLRALFLVRGAMLRYRLESPGFELPEEMLPAQAEFDHELAETLDGIAERMAGEPNPRDNRLPEALEKLEEAAKAPGRRSPRRTSTISWRSLALPSSLQSR